ncbi:HAD-IA family hydrolase [Salmonella enterica]|nr:HAD family hydrolase [Salmonella enterica]EDQ4604319.1 HAD-IA family hydrolase [Salmonella enterica subsp. arizonae]EEP9823201.1 HAD-IA family hydrolase [Salmonella enterica subsp. diarizonae]HCM1848036.1 HAD-IA family hydrolase [Salmonella enterica subsp. diarizonae serovar 16:z10:e,n,x,z15]EAM8742026.1 HAD family hydrolase [Salmonella enterica]
MKIIWFDFGGVLSPSVPDLFTSYYLKTGIPPAVLQRAMKEVADDMNMDVLAPVEKAIITEREWGAGIRLKLSQSAPELDLSQARLEQFGEQWFDGILPNQLMIDLFRKVKATGLKAGILTNNVVEWENHWKRVAGISEEADVIVDSCKVGCRKPETEIFAIAAERAGVRPEENLLIDDVPENCMAARQCGWESVHFKDNSSAVTEVIAVLQRQEIFL